MKKVFKLGCLGFAGLIALIIIVAAMGTGDDSADTGSDTTTATEETKSEPVSTTPKEEPEEEGKISLEEFNAIKTGMTYEEVVEIIGGEGVVQSETGTEGDQFYTVMYSWEGEKGFGANANAMFQGGKLESKAQFGLE